MNVWQPPELTRDGAATEAQLTDCDSHEKEIGDS